MTETLADLERELPPRYHWLLAHTRELRAALAEVRQCPRCQSCADTASDLLARYPEGDQKGGA